MGQVLTGVLTTITPEQEEKVLEALGRSLDLTLAKKGNESGACAVKADGTTNQRSGKSTNSIANSINVCKTFFKEGAQRDDSRS